MKAQWLWVGSLSLALSVVVGCKQKEQAGHGSEHKESAQHNEHEGEHASSGTVADTVVEGKARDPICGMTTKADGNPDFVYRDTRFHFCSANHLEKFKAAPSKATTGLPREDCVCTVGKMKNCTCGHCKGKPERCSCGDPESEKEGSEGHKHDDH